MNEVADRFDVGTAHIDACAVGVIVIITTRKDACAVSNLKAGHLDVAPIDREASHDGLGTARLALKDD